MSISVLMAVYDEPENLYLEAIRSVVDQTKRPTQLVLVNDNPSRQLNTQHIQAIAGDDVAVTILNNPQNMGLGMSLNRGLDAVTGSYVARMDADDVSLPQRFEHQLKFLEAHPEMAAVFCAVEDDVLAKYLDGTFSDCPTFESDFFRGNPFRHATMMMRIEPYRKLKYKQRGRTEDHDLYFRMARAGLQAGFVPYIGYVVNKSIKYGYRDKRRHQRAVAAAWFSKVWLYTKYYSVLKNWQGFSRSYKAKLGYLPKAALIWLRSFLPG